MGRPKGSRDSKPRKKRVDLAPVDRSRKGVHPKTEWKKGQKPAGSLPHPPPKPKGAISFRRLITELCESSPEEASGRKPVTIGQAMVMAQVQQAMKGDVRAFEALVERVEPKVSKISQTIGNPDGSPLIPAADLSRLTPEELRALRPIIAKATPDAPADA